MPMKPFVALVASNHWRIVIGVLANWTNWNFHPCFRSSALLRPQILHRQKNGSLCGLLPWTNLHILMSFLPWESSRTACIGLKPKFFQCYQCYCLKFCLNLGVKNFWLIWHLIWGLISIYIEPPVWSSLKYWKIWRNIAKFPKNLSLEICSERKETRFAHVKYELR